MMKKINTTLTDCQFQTIRYPEKNEEHNIYISVTNADGDEESMLTKLATEAKVNLILKTQ